MLSPTPAPLGSRRRVFGAQHRSTTDVSTIRFCLPATRPPEGAYGAGRPHAPGRRGHPHPTQCSELPTGGVAPGHRGENAQAPEHRGDARARQPGPGLRGCRLGGGARGARPRGGGRGDALLYPTLRQSGRSRRPRPAPAHRRPRHALELGPRRPATRDARGERVGRVPRRRSGGTAVDAAGDRGAAVRERRLRGESRRAAPRAAPGDPRREGGRRHPRSGLDPVTDRPMTTATSPATGPVSRIDPEAAYRRPTAPGPALLRLDSNEGVLPPEELLAGLAGADPELLRRYPEVSELEAALAARLAVAPERVIVTAGADEAIDRACRAFLEPSRTLVLPDPCFDMFDRCAALAGGTLVRVAWRDGPFPLDRFLERVDARTAVVVVVTPNNPTGAVATLAQVRRLAAAAPNALLVIDHVYVEYADEDLTPGALTLPNALVLRTFTKAWGLAGCRVGYGVGSPYVIGVLRAAGGPYSVAAPSIALALAQLERGEGALRAHVARIRTERGLLTARLAAAGGGLAPQPSQANFVLVECGGRAQPIRAALAERGVVVRDFPGRPGLETSLRITLPGTPTDFERLCAALDAALAAAGPRP